MQKCAAFSEMPEMCKSPYHRRDKVSTPATEEKSSTLSSPETLSMYHMTRRCITRSHGDKRSPSAQKAKWSWGKPWSKPIVIASCRGVIAIVDPGRIEGRFFSSSAPAPRSFFVAGAMRGRQYQLRPTAKQETMGTGDAIADCCRDCRHKRLSTAYSTF